MTTPNTTLTPTQRVEQDAANHSSGVTKSLALQLATELEAAQRDLEATGRVVLARDSSIANLRQQLADKTRECDAARKEQG